MHVIDISNLPRPGVAVPTERFTALLAAEAENARLRKIEAYRAEDKKAFDALQENRNQLERENSKLREQVADATIKLGAAKGMVRTALDDRDQALRENAKLREENAELKRQLAVLSRRMS